APRNNQRLSRLGPPWSVLVGHSESALRDNHPGPSDLHKEAECAKCYTPSWNNSPQSCGNDLNPSRGDEFMTQSLAGQSRMVFVAMAAVMFVSVGSAIATDPVQARKDIKAMGMEYTGQDFAKAAGNGDMTAVQLFLDAGMDVNTGGGRPSAW